MNYYKLKEALKPQIAGYFEFGIDDLGQTLCAECSLDTAESIETVQSTIGFEPCDVYECENCGHDINQSDMA